MRRTLRCPHRLLAVLVTALLALALTPPTHARAAGTRPFSLTVTHIECVDDCDETGLEALFEGHAEAQSRDNNLQTLVPNLVEAMFTGFPGNSGERVRITVAPPEKG